MESLFIELIEDPDPEYRMPSKEKAPVPEEEIELLKRWVNEGMEWETGFAFGEPAYQGPLKPSASPSASRPQGRTGQSGRSLGRCHI